MNSDPENFEFREEYWEEAQRVLQRAERRLWWRRALKVTFGVAMLFLVVFVSVCVIHQKNAGSTQKASLHQNLHDQQGSLMKGADSSAKSDRGLVSDSIHAADLDTLSVLEAMQPSLQTGRTVNSKFSDPIGTEVPGGSAVLVAAIDAADQSQYGGKTASTGVGSSHQSHAATVVALNDDQHGEKTEARVHETSDSSTRNDRLNLSRTEGSTVLIEGMTLLVPSSLPASFQTRTPLFDTPFKEVKPPLSSPPPGISVYAGMVASFGINAQAMGVPFNPEIGMKYERRVLNRLSLSLGVGIMHFQGASAQKEYLAEMPAFGSSYRSTVISAHRLYVLDLPIELVVDLSDRHSFLAGVGIDYIIQTHNRIRETEVTPFGELLVDATNDKGYLAGVQPVMLNARVGYRYRITGRLTAGLHLATGRLSIPESSAAYRSRLNVRLNWRVL